MFRKKAIFIGILLAGCLLINGIGHAATINASSCSQSDVLSAINSSNTGDTVVIPSGTCSWSASVAVNKNIIVQGAGSGVGGTKLQRSSGSFFNSAGNPRITGIHFEASGTAENYIQIKGTGGWRINNCRIENTTTMSRVGVYVRFNSTDGQPVGLIDNNIFENCRVYVQSGLITAYNTLMDESSLLGTGNTVYIEDNVMDRTGYASVGGSGNVIDSQYGGSFVFRFNTVTNAHLEVHAPGGGNTPARGGRYWEIYGNSMSHPSSAWDRAIFIRGGTGVIFNNEITDAGFERNNIDLDIHNQRNDTCNGSSSADGNLGSKDNAGWPCRDQIGRATDSFLWQSGGSVPSQKSEPAYFWGNAGFDSAQIYSGDGSYIVQGRDYYEDDDIHMKSGVWADRPETCDEGDGYWATDLGEWNSNNAGNDGALYICNDSNRFVLYYTPYTYPHPLRQTSGGLEQLQPPKNLQIIN